MAVLNKFYCKLEMTQLQIKKQHKALEEKTIENKLSGILLVVEENDIISLFLPQQIGFSPTYHCLVLRASFLKNYSCPTLIHIKDTLIATYYIGFKYIRSFPVFA